MSHEACGGVMSVAEDPVSRVTATREQDKRVILRDVRVIISNGVMVSEDCCEIPRVDFGACCMVTSDLLELWV
jgi:hypothetical protein